MVRVRPLTCGWLSADAGTMLTGQAGTMRMPAGAFLVEHPEGVVVFDTGMHPVLAEAGGTSRLGPIESLFEIDLDEHGSLAAQLGTLGLAPDDVDTAVVSHLHFDHCGGLAQLPRARLVAQQAEWDAAFDDDAVALGVYNPEDFDLGHDRQLLDGEHDLFGDGAVRLVPTPGHTAGHQSMLIEGRLLLVGDACYTQHALDADLYPPFRHDHEGQRRGYDWLRQQQGAGVSLVYSHDADQVGVARPCPLNPVASR